MTTFHHLMLPDDTKDTPRRYGVTGNGVTDDTAALTRLFEAGGDIYIPDGDYLIAGAGADTGGVAVTITKSTCVRCHPNARFFTDSLDNDLIRFTVPSNGSGLPTDGITFEWRGGIFDQREQKVSTVVPHIGDYPPVNAGASATCDGLSVRGDYTDGVMKSGIKRTYIEGVTCIAGDHWESAGGDSGIFVGGCAQQTVTGCRFIGNRDLGVYTSGSTDGTLNCKTLITDCDFINCFYGASVKRSAGDSEISNCTATNCVAGFLTSLAAGSGFNRVRIRGNSGSNLGTPIRLDLTIGFNVSDNHFTTLGALLEDGTTIEPIQGCNGIDLRGCSYGICQNNTVRGIETGVAAAYPTQYMLFILKQESTTATECTRVEMVRNIGDGLRTAGTDATGSNNSYIENCVINAVTSANVSNPGTNYFELRIDPSTGMRGYANPVGFADGTASAPSVARRGQVNTGLFFAASRLGVSIATVETLRVDNDSTAGNTRMMVFDVDNNALERVSVGAADSGGAGFKVLRIPN